MHKVLIVVPCYNEEARLPTGDFKRFVLEHPEVGFLFVNDGSTDKTGQLLGSLCRVAPSSLHVITMERNVGKGEAVRTGIQHALETRGVEYIGFWDADLATPLEEIGNFVRIHEENPELILVMGARIPLLGRRITRHAFRRYASALFAFAVSETLHVRVHDTQCGAKLFRVEPLTRHIFEQPFATRWFFDVEILDRMIQAHGNTTNRSLGDLVHELPLQKWEDVRGSNRTLRDYFDAVHCLFVLRGAHSRTLMAL